MGAGRARAGHRIQHRRSNRPRVRRRVRAHERRRSQGPNTLTSIVLPRSRNDRTKCHRTADAVLWLSVYDKSKPDWHVYEITTGSTGARGANAPDRKAAKPLPVVVAPSGKMSNGHLTSASPLNLSLISRRATRRLAALWPPIDADGAHRLQNAPDDWNIK